MRWPLSQHHARKKGKQARGSQARNGHGARIGLAEVNGAAVCYGADLRFSVGAGDGNRTRITSLEGVPGRAVVGPGLQVQVPGGVRGCPLVTLANGTLMARRSRHPRVAGRRERRALHGRTTASYSRPQPGCWGRRWRRQRRAGPRSASRPLLSGRLRQRCLRRGLCTQAGRDGLIHRLIRGVHQCDAAARHTGSGWRTTSGARR
jgi:hypothetical protein